MFELTAAGVERAEALSSYLTRSNSGPGSLLALPGSTNVVLFNYGPPFALFASRPVQHSDDFTVRCIETRAPQKRV